MISTIGPLVQGSVRLWAVSMTLFVAASTAAAFALGVTIGGVGWLTIGWVPLTERILALALIVLVAGAHDLHLIPSRLPQNARSVPQRWWTQWGPERASAAFGAVLGLGITTVIPYASFYALLLAIWLLADPITGGAVLAAYGFGRGIPVVLASLSFAFGTDLGRDLEPLLRGRPRIQRLIGAAALVAGFVLGIRAA